MVWFPGIDSINYSGNWKPSTDLELYTLRECILCAHWFISYKNRLICKQCDLEDWQSK